MLLSPICHILTYLTLWEFRKNSREMFFSYLLYVIFLLASVCENSRKIYVNFFSPISFMSYSYLPHSVRILEKFMWNVTSPISYMSYSYLPHFVRIPKKFTWIIHVKCYCSFNTPPCLTLWEYLGKIHVKCYRSFNMRNLR